MRQVAEGGKITKVSALQITEASGQNEKRAMAKERTGLDAHGSLLIAHCSLFISL
jgi:hypothetical protein